MKINNIVVGCGFAGAVLARRISEEKNEEVLIIEKHNHIGGHAYDYYNENGILIHKYGPHIFHTNNMDVWKWLSRFTEWYHYQHRVLSYVDGLYVPMPISAETINMLYNTNLSTKEIQKWLDENSEKIKDIKTSEDVVISKAGREIYEKFFKGYTYKQWGKYPDELDSSVISRIPVRNNRDTRYFTDKYQGVPKYGYFTLFENIINHPKIKIMLNTGWHEIRGQIKYDKLYYTGTIDGFYNHCFGELEYRSVKFEYETLFGIDNYQPVGTVNYPSDYDFTRITEYKHLTNQLINRTTIAREYSCNEGEPFYPVADEKNKIIAKKYLQHGKNEKNTIFIGRLAEYAYLNMDKVVENSLNLEL
jgi:UDP-galactopyranose mutase